jgi:hypothetical protein
MALLMVEGLSEGTGDTPRQIHTESSKFNALTVSGAAVALGRNPPQPATGRCILHDRAHNHEGALLAVQFTART